jgi:transcriptional regulator with XRE-family HTH domain
MTTIAPEQLRAARGLLDWSRAELSEASGLSPETIKNIEHGTFKPEAETIDKILRAFHYKGVEFIDIRKSLNNSACIGVILNREEETANRGSNFVKLKPI